MPRLARVPLVDLLNDAADQIAGHVVRSDALPPLWAPLAAQPGRGMRLPDGRVVSPQQAAIESLADELFYGGAGGGGKTSLLVGVAFTEPGSSVLFRKEFTQFEGPEGLLEYAKTVAGLRGPYNGRNHTFTIDGGVSHLELGSVPDDRSRQKWRGRPHARKLFDELPQFTEAEYRFLIAWLRTSVPGQRTRVISTGNPPDAVEGQWVIKYWGPWLDKAHARPAKPGELRWFATVDDKDVEVPSGDPVTLTDREGKPRVVKPRSRTFIPASLADNPYYMATGYADVLDNLPEPLRSQMLLGDFAAAMPDHAWQVIPTAWVVQAQARWRPREITGPPTAVGNDPSRGGKDEFVVAKRYPDGWFGPLEIHDAKEAPDGIVGAQILFKSLGGDATVPVQIDIGGMAGSSVYDQGRAIGLRAIPMNGAMASFARDRSGRLGFVNKRAQWAWQFREWLDPGSGLDLALPPDPQMRSDLCAMRWKMTPRGIQIEAKEDLKKRLGRSPDRGEAVIYCAADEYSLAEMTITSGAPVPDSALSAEELAAREAAKAAKATQVVVDQIARDGVYWPGGR